MQKIPHEEWRPVVGYEGFYEVSNMGQVRSLDRQKWTGKAWYTLPGRIRSPGYDKDKYLAMPLYGNGTGQRMCKVHRLVAEAFIPNTANLKEINHKDGNKENNSVENLEWCNRQHNIIHSRRTGLHRQVRGSQIGRSKLDEEKVVAIRAMFAEGNITKRALGKLFGVDETTILAIINRKLWKHI